MADRQRVDPYGFVPLGPRPPVRERVADGHNRLHRHRLHGWLTCRLTTKTPLFIGSDSLSATPEAEGRKVLRFPVAQGECVIPGSSLKGVIRSLFEAIEPSCFILPDDWVDGRKRYQGSGITRDKAIAVQLPDGFETCHDTDNLCPACRVFGSVGAGGGAWAGRVAISDARARPGQFQIMKRVTLGVLASPKPEARRSGYVVGPANVVMGRKFYRHRLDPVVQGDPRNPHAKTVEPVAHGAVFSFTVQYENLTREEMRPLLYALALEDGLWHKLGMGKPLGLGSAHIEIVEWRRLDPQARYRKRGSGIEILEGEALGLTLDQEVAVYRRTAGQPTEPENLKALREILRARHDFDVSYAQARPQAGPPPGRPPAPQAGPPLRTEWRRSRR